MMNNMIKRGIIIKDKRGFYIVDDVDVADRFAIIRKIMRDRKGNIYYGNRIFIGLKQLDNYKLI